MPRTRSAPFFALAILVAALGAPGCHDPEDGRVRGREGGDGGNYVAGRVHAPSKIDGTRDLSLLNRAGPRPRGNPPVPRTAERARGPSAPADGKH